MRAATEVSVTGQAMQHRALPHDPRERRNLGLALLIAALAILDQILLLRIFEHAGLVS
jgi:hypothetical protein